MKNLSKNIKKNIEYFKTQLNNSESLICKEFKVGKTPVSVFYIIGLIDIDSLALNVIKPCQAHKGTLPKNKSTEYIKDNIITIGGMFIEKDIIKLEDLLLKGNGIFFVDGQAEAIVLTIDKVRSRAIEEPPTSAVLKGPRSGFVENIKVNLAQLRKILSTKDLILNDINIGKYTKTQVTIVYIKSIADKKVVQDVLNVLNKIEIDGIIDSNYIAQFLEQKKNSIFKQVGLSEKPDVISAKLLEGRVAIVVDGSPIVLTVPFMLIEDIQNSNDYYSQYSHATFLRSLRIFSILVTMLLPAFYIAVELHHYKTIPLKFLITIINTTQDLPLTPFIEIIFVLILFEILYEASLRMPRYLGLALSVVGALILGDTAVKAGIISPPAVMIVAISGITLYTVPDQAQQLSILRFIFTLAGGFLGFYGIVLLTVYLMIYLNDFDAYGSPYLAPFAPYVKNDIQDSIIKADLTKLIRRPQSIPNSNSKRMKSQ